MIEFENVKYLSASEVAEIFKVTPKTVRQLFKEGKMPYKKFGRTMFVAEKDLKSYFNGGADSGK